MFLCEPLLEVLTGRGIADIDAFLTVPSWNDLPDPFSIPLMEEATARVLGAIRNRERIASLAITTAMECSEPTLTQRA